MMLFFGEVWHGGACFKDNGLNFVCGNLFAHVGVVVQTFLGVFLFS